MLSRSGRIISVIVCFVMVAALLISCQTASPAPTQKAGGGNDVNVPLIQNNTAGTTQAYPAGSQPQQPAVDNSAYPAGGQAQAQPPADPNANTAYPAANGAPAVQNKTKVLAQFIEQKSGDSQDRVVLRAKILSAQPEPGMPDFVSKMVNQDVDLMVNVAGLPQLAANDKFEALVSYLGDENSGKYFADQVKKQ